MESISALLPIAGILIPILGLLSYWGFNKFLSRKKDNKFEKLLEKTNSDAEKELIVNHKKSVELETKIKEKEKMTERKRKTIKKIAEKSSEEINKIVNADESSTDWDEIEKNIESNWTELL